MRSPASCSPPQRYAVIQEWQGLIASAPAVDAFIASGYDDSDFIDMAELRGRRR
ncbi:hypothetical protein [Streptomyces sp. NPDC058620]|uniref:hypothetical protein n=1 Tax=Streptomyces sp. NPDC058620 TaxID=3346560 RepID=UPI003654551C